MMRCIVCWLIGGAITNDGNIKYTLIETDGGLRNVIGVDLDLVLADLRRYFNETEIDRNFIKATVVVNGKPFYTFLSSYD